MGTTPAAPTSPAGIASAEAEQEWYYASDKKKRGHKRSQFSKDVVHYGSVAVLLVAASCMVGGILVWAAHQILPTKYLWLDETHIANLAGDGKVLLSGSIGALGSKFLARNIEPD